MPGVKENALQIHGVSGEDIWGKRNNGKNTKPEREQSMEVLQRKMRKCCSVQTLKRKLPILTWLSKYSTADLVGDIIAGFTVGLTVMPQGIAYALIANLPPNYGLYSAFLGSFIYVVFGSCKDITIGPTAIMALLTFEYAHGDPDVAILLSFTSGVIILLCGLFNLGFLTSLISKTVISAFTSAAAITIFSSQLKGLFGLKFSAHGFISSWTEFFSHLSDTRWQDLSLGLSCIVVLLILRKLKDLKMCIIEPSDSLSKKITKKMLFLVSVGRNALVVIIATLISSLLDKEQPFIITGEIKAGLPDFVPPSFTGKNGSATFVDVLSDVGAGVAILPLISILESIAIASAFAKGRAIDGTQEMIALGLCNLFGSFVQSMPTTGSFSRTAINSTSGVRTPAGGIVTGILIIVALAVLTPYFKCIPISAMSAVIICAVIFMVDVSSIRTIYSVSQKDHLVLWVTFLVCLGTKLELGILAGMLLNLAFLLIMEGNPDVRIEFYSEEKEQCPSHLVLIPHSGLNFLNADRLRQKISKASASADPRNLPFIVDCSRFNSIDYTGAKVFQSLALDARNRRQLLIFVECSPPVHNALKALNTEIIILERSSLRQALLCLLRDCHSDSCTTCSSENQHLINSLSPRDEELHV